MARCEGGIRQAVRRSTRAASFSTVCIPSSTAPNFITALRASIDGNVERMVSSVRPAVQRLERHEHLEAMRVIVSVRIVTVSQPLARHDLPIHDAVWIVGAIGAVHGEPKQPADPKIHRDHA